MRRMSFSATVEQMRNRSKTVTRRDPATWVALKPGDRVLAIEKAMGLPKGAHQVPIGVIEIVSVRVVALEPVIRRWWVWFAVEARREGFNTWAEFAEAWRLLHGSYCPSAEVRRIEFRHVADPESCISGIRHDSE